MTENKLADLSPVQKRQKKIDKFLDAKDVNFINDEARKAYHIRAQRLIDAYSVQEPDRVPVNLPLGNLPYFLYGLNTYDVMYNYDRAIEACNRFNHDYSAELEVFATPGIMSGKALEILGYKLYVWPGSGLPLDATGFQFVEGEYMKADEYDFLIRDPSDFWIRTYLPRIFGVFEPLRMTRPVTDITEIIGAQQLSVLSLPEMQLMLRTLIEAGQEYRKLSDAMKNNSTSAEANGFPVVRGIFCKAPFDVLGDTLRGTKGIMTDMYRQPDKLLEALDVIADVTIGSVLNSPMVGDALFVSYPLHKGADGWMSQKQFEKFYWPSLRKVMNAFIQEGLMQHLFAEGSFNTRLETVNEFPKGFVSWLFDQTDMAKAKKVLGKNCCIEGNIPSSLIVTGSPDLVKNYCKKLIDICAPGGGYIMAAGATPDRPELENLKAIMDTVRQYGVYR